MKKAFWIGVLTLIVVAGVFASSWSSWNYLTSVDGVELHYKYRHRSDYTDVKWKVVNNTSGVCFASVEDKVYTLAGGGTTSKSDEGSRVRSYSEYTFVEDIISGEVTYVQASLNIRWE